MLVCPMAKLTVLLIVLQCVYVVSGDKSVEEYEEDKLVKRDVPPSVKIGASDNRL